MMNGGSLSGSASPAASRPQSPPLVSATPPSPSLFWSLGSRFRGLLSSRMLTTFNLRDFGKATATSNYYNDRVERYLWRFLSFFSCVGDPLGWNGVTSMLGLLYDRSPFSKEKQELKLQHHTSSPAPSPSWNADGTHNATIQQVWRLPQGAPSVLTSTSSPTPFISSTQQGLTMAKSILPNLLQAISLTASTPNSLEDYGKATMCFLFLDSDQDGDMYSWLAWCVFAVCDRTVLRPKPLLFIFSWWVSLLVIHRAPANWHRVFTRGEYVLCTACVALLWTETVASVFASIVGGATDTTTGTATDASTGTKSRADTVSVHTVVALLGMTSVLVGCFVDQIWSRNSLWMQKSVQYSPVGHVLLRLALIAGLTFTVLELWFFGRHRTSEKDSYSFPHCLYWLWNFLTEHEGDTEGKDANRSVLEALGHNESNTEFATESKSSYPRWYWLAYWIVALLILIPLSPSTSHQSLTMASQVTMRKYFHFVAVVLFLPVTVYSPQLMSFSYAISIALLCILECIRMDVPGLQRFYQRYVDPSKDSADRVMISHLTLILGCAIPLWMSQYLQENDTTSDYSGRLREPLASHGLLALWGVLCIGIADAVAAWVGTNYGSIPWGHRRSLEGSLAFAASLTAGCLCVNPYLSIISWLPAVVFVTLMEAFTDQIDNLVLPLAGSCLLLLSHLTFAVPAKYVADPSMTSRHLHVLSSSDSMAINDATRMFMLENSSSKYSSAM
jgi:dolichol kinase